MSSSKSETVWFVTGYANDLAHFVFTNLICHRSHVHRTSRGIGLEITKQLLQSPDNIVLAACRTPSKADALQALTASAGARLHILRLDVDDTQSINDAAGEAAQIVGDKGIDYLINNAGIVSHPASSRVQRFPTPESYLPCFPNGYYPMSVEPRRARHGLRVQGRGP